MDTMIAIRNVHKSFGDNHVLRGINLDIPRGKVTVIIGRSGEGKSVLMKHMIGLIQPDAGNVVVNGQDLSQLDVFELNELRKLYGMLFQSAALFDSFTVGENVAFPLQEHTGLGSEEIAAQVRENLAMVGLEGVEDQLPSQLSGGMKKRVGLARAIALKPQILLYDEPTTGLDPLLTDAIDRLILQMQETLGTTAVVISHDINGALKIADQLAMLKEGRIILSGDAETFQATHDPFVQRFIRGEARGDEN